MTIDEVKAAKSSDQHCLYKWVTDYMQGTTEDLIVRIDWISPQPFSDAGTVVHVIVIEGPYEIERHILNEKAVMSQLTLAPQEVQ